MIERKREITATLNLIHRKKCETILNTSPGAENKKIFIYIFDMFPYVFISMLYI